jgi:hypothetical protein
VALDHYVSQVHLKQFFSPKLGLRMHGTKKSDLKSFLCHSKDVCRIEEGSSNAYLIHDRAVEEFLKGVEPNYDKSLARLREKALDEECIATFAGFAAYVTSCSPAAMRIHTGPLEKALETTAIILDRQGLIEKAPPELGSKPITEPVEDGTLRYNVDPKYPQAIGITTINRRMSVWGNSEWEILKNETDDSPFFTSDYPVALEAKSHNRANWIVPLAPDTAIRIIPDIDLSGTRPDLPFRKFSCHYRAPSRTEIVDINRLIVRCAEDTVFYRDDFPWVGDFIKKNRNYRIDTITERRPTNAGFLIGTTQRIVKCDRGLKPPGIPNDANAPVSSCRVRSTAAERAELTRT